MSVRRVVVAALIVLASAGARRAPAQSAGPRVEIVVPRAAHDAPITGRVYVAISRTSSAESTPIAQAEETGAPLFGADVDALAPGTAAVIDASAFGHPVRSLRDIPAGTYWVQPFVNVYTKFARADGHPVWLHMDQWEGQDWRHSPGNLYGEPVRVTIDPASPAPIRLVADHVIPPIVVSRDSGNVRRLKIR
ncbi:MAG TPA: hypothetical protein VFP90_13000, partial [Gemmatimonadaceae bacterium]|nr:hypothetical protein [Gemmatimonadaceae bacterium]